MKSVVALHRRGHIANTIIRIGEKAATPGFRPLTPLGIEMGRLARAELARKRGRS